MHSQQCVVSANRCTNGDVAYSPLDQAKNHLMAIGSLIAIGKMASFEVPPAGKKLVMSISSDALEASITAFPVAKEGDVALPPSLFIKY